MKKILLLAMSIMMVTAFSFGQESQTKSKAGEVKSAVQDKTKETNNKIKGTESGVSSSQSATGTGVSGAVQPSANTKVSEKGKDLAFVNEAASAGLMEVQLGKLAQQKATSQQVKDFGRMMERDHSDANSKLKAAMQKVGVTVPSNMIEKHEDNVESLSKKSGADFDKAYVDLMVKDHKEDVNKFEKASSEIQDASLKQWVSSTLPVLKKHLAEAEKLQARVK
jgi:putative membrane protein